MIGATMLFSLSVISIRFLSRAESAGVISVFVMRMFVVAGAAAMPFMWVTPTPVDMIVMVVNGVLSASAMCCTINSFRIASPALLGPF